MTKNQIDLRKVKAEEERNRETARSNQKNEYFTERQTRAKEKETDSKVQLNNSQRAKNHTGAASDIFNIGRSAAGIIAAANDPSWYNLDPSLVKDVASISYEDSLGGRETWTYHQGDASKLDREDGAVAIDVITTIPCIGIDPQSSSVAGGAATSANIAARNIYGFVRHANSGSANYEAADLMLYLLSMDSLYTIFACGIRAYSVALTAKGANRAYPRAMLEALGFDPDDVITNLATFRSYLNTVAMRLNALYVPKDLSYYARHIWMYSNIFKDDPVKKSREHVFVPRYLTSFTLDNDGRGCLAETAAFTPLNKMTVEQYQTKFEFFYARVFNEEDMNIMSGDILKAYGESNTMYTSSIPSDFHIESVYSPEVLTQIQGAVAIGYSEGSCSVYQDDHGNIYQGQKVNNYDYRVYGSAITLPSIPSVDTYGDTLALNNKFMDGSWIINMYKDDPTPDDNMIATRLTVSAKHQADVNKIIVYSAGSEIPLEFYDLVIGPDGSVIDQTFNSNRTSFQRMSGISTSYFFNRYAKIGQFQWIPRIKYFSATNNTSFFTNVLFWSGDLDNFTVVDANTLARMHRVAILSEFAIPALGPKVRSRR